MTSTTIARPFAAAAHWGLPLLLAVAMLLTAAGCSNNAVEINTPAEFDKVLAETKQPVLILFWKFGCASCMFLEPGFEKLATEYKGRIFAGRVMIMNLMFLSPFPEVKAKYEIGFVPVVILFQDGQEKQRWTVDYSMEKYEKALTALVGPPDKPGPASQPASRPASQPGEPDYMAEAEAALAEAVPETQPAPSTQPTTQPATK
ncbi:MAG: thioredoxin domain-containing protein [Planctomycetota bacterium]|jgi:thioredoxin-like negative regulator of GroEL